MDAHDKFGYAQLRRLPYHAPTTWASCQGAFHAVMETHESTHKIPLSESWLAIKEAEPPGHLCVIRAVNISVIRSAVNVENLVADIQDDNPDAKLQHAFAVTQPFKTELALLLSLSTCPAAATALMKPDFRWYESEFLIAHVHSFLLLNKFIS